MHRWKALIFVVFPLSPLLLWAGLMLGDGGLRGLWENIDTGTWGFLHSGLILAAFASMALAAASAVIFGVLRFARHLRGTQRTGN